MERGVVVAGWGQVTQRKEQVEGLRGPLGLMEEAARRAAERAGSADLLRRLDGVLVVQVMSAQLPGAAARLAERLGASPRLLAVSDIGGSSPQLLINRAAGMIARGELDLALVAGGETYYPRGGERGVGLFQGLEGDEEREDLIGSSEVERRHGLVLPLDGFPLLETALWAESGQPLEAYLGEVAALWSRFSQAAAANPFAWSREPRSAAELATPSARNRRVAFPYTKFMTSLLSVDLGAAVLLAPADSRPAAKPAGRPVHFLAGAYRTDRQRYLIERSSFTTSPALGAAARAALGRAGLDLGQVEAFDLYSCFPCAVTIAMRELGLARDEARPLTLTGGLGFLGGPGNDYGLHAVASLAEAISSGRYETGLVNGLGWFLHKHAVGLYGARPRGPGLGREALEDERAPAFGQGPRPAADRVADGETGVLETYTVLHGRDGSPERALLLGTTAAGLRFVARAPALRSALDALEASCQVGRRVRLCHDRSLGLNLAELA